MDYFKHLYGAEGKTALVTGGAKGLGRIISEALVRAGAHVLISSRDGDECERVAAELRAYGKCHGFAGDISTESDVAALAAVVREQTEKLDILVNNAGRTWGAPLESFPWKAWGRVLDVNLVGNFELTKLLLPLLAAAGTESTPARIINLGSIFGTIAVADHAYSYAASKAAIHHMTRLLAFELAGKHITVNAISPGPFLTSMTAHSLGDVKNKSKIGATIPMGRVGEDDDLAGAVLYLCGKSGAFVTGAVIPIDGGLAVQTRDALFEMPD